MQKLLLIAWTLSPAATAGEITEFCLNGQFDLGARLQGMVPAAGELYPTSFCVTTDASSNRALFIGRGQSNPEMPGDFSVLYLPPDTVRILTGEGEPDVAFRDTDNLDEAKRVRRLDPRRLIEEWRKDPDALRGVELKVSGSAGGEQLDRLSTTVELPLRGIVDAVWDWNWSDPDEPQATLTVDNEVLFVATGNGRNVGDANRWASEKDIDAVVLPGGRWPASVDMSLETVADGVYLVRHVRTGFQHMVVDSSDGLVIADAPAGWVEFHQVPPADLVPGLGVSGLSERFVDFLREQLPDRPIVAVALTHAHDDHAGGARAFAAAGADIYAPRESAQFIANGLNRLNAPADRLSALKRPAAVSPLDATVELGNAPNRVRLVTMGESPHVDSMLGIWAVDRDIFFVSDVHVPRSESDAPPDTRAATECWFATWATANLPPRTVVINSHSSIRTPVSRLERYLDSQPCKH